MCRPTQLTGRAEGLEFAEIGKVKPKLGDTRDVRRTRRGNLGTLRENTVGVKARKRYNSALASFYSFCQCRRIRIPDHGEELDLVGIR